MNTSNRSVLMFLVIIARIIYVKFYQIRLDPFSFASLTSDTVWLGVL
jgi:hypothetical protein